MTSDASLAASRRTALVGPGRKVELLSEKETETVLDTGSR
ncbi:hypothetical protein Q7C_2725 (plasmid) [Methylophaga frappieri]|uniref:Uncharacterized protein n=1 Tax=Methylophaga frappieri (strain ATCC BAA-2434 / DSM 25690 / JAM7) TaxID=754477 RepID=I1YLQ2_METFJ|nr:hypothetical protein Q7C_2725 [Methylophaga frappieri]